MQAQSGTDYMKATPGEQDPTLPHGEGEGHHKQSVASKVKSKAKKLSSKIKGVGKKKKTGAEGHGTEGHEMMEGQVHEHNEAEDTSSSSEGEHEEDSSSSSPQISHTGPLGASPETREDRPVHGGGGYGKGDDRSGVDHASRGIAGLSLGGIEAKQDPNLPSYGDETTKRQNVPSAIGQDTAQVSPDLTSGLGGGAYDRGHEKSSYDQGLGSGHDSGYEKSTYDRGLGSGHESGYGSGFGTSGFGTQGRDSSVETGAPVGGQQSDVKIPEGIMKPREEESKPVLDGVDHSGRDILSSEVLGSGQSEELSRPSESYGENQQDKPLSDKAKGALAGGLGLGGIAAGTAAGEHATHDDQYQSTDPQQQKGWMQRASEGVASVFTSKLASPRASDTAPAFDKSPEDKSYTESARDTAIGAKDATYDTAVGAKDATRDSAIGTKDATYDTAAGATGRSAADTSRPWTEQAKLAVLSAKDTVASKLPSSTGPTTETSAETKPLSTRAGETATGVKDGVASKLGYGGTTATDRSVTEPYGHNQPAAAGGPTVTDKVLGTVTGVKDTLASKLGYGGTTGTATEARYGDTTTGTTLGSHSDTTTGTTLGSHSDTTTGTTLGSHSQPGTAGGPTVTEKVLGSVTGVKDTLASKLGYGGTTGTTTGTTGTTTGTGYGGTTGTTTGTGYGDTSTGTTTGTEAAKRFHPDEHDTALSQKITDMLSLGGSPKTSSTTPTTTTTAVTTESSPRTTDELTAGSPTQGKGYMDRMTDVVGSLLGKKPADAATGTTEKDAALTQQ